jgi:hypothetical protein
MMESTPKFLERVCHLLALSYGFLDPIVHGDQFRHQFKHLVQLVAGNGDDAFQWITEDDITLAIIVKSICLQTKRQSYRRNRDSSNRDRHVPSSGFRLGAAANSRRCKAPDLARPS